MNHLTIDQLLALRQPGLEPGVQAWQAHVESCPSCRAELDRLDQRVAKLKALPTLRPSADRFAAVRDRAAAERRVLRFRRGVRLTLGLAAIAAAVTLTVTVGRKAIRPDRELVRVSPELEEAMTRSQQLEQAISQFDQDRQVVDGRMASITWTLEDRLARVDRQIEVVDLMEPAMRQTEALRLWRERVGLLDALMDVHVTGARYVGF
jgi:hypothetical protein